MSIIANEGGLFLDLTSLTYSFIHVSLAKGRLLIISMHKFTRTKSNTRAPIAPSVDTPSKARDHGRVEYILACYQNIIVSNKPAEPATVPRQKEISSHGDIFALCALKYCSQSRPLRPNVRNVQSLHSTAPRQRWSYRSLIRPRARVRHTLSPVAASGWRVDLGYEIDDCKRYTRPGEGWPRTVRSRGRYLPQL